MTDLQRTRQYLPTFTHVSLSPSIKFFSTLRIESLDQILIAIIRLTTSWAGSDRLFDHKRWNRCLDCFQYVTTLYIWKHQ